MKVSGKITVQAPRERVFDAIQDARFFASCIDGVRDLKEVDETHYTAVLETKVAYIKFCFDVEVEVARKEPPNLIEARAVGTPAGVVGRLTSIATTTLYEEGENTVIDYAIDATLSGKLGSIGQPVLMSKAREMEREFTKRLRAAFAEAPPAGAEGAAQAPAETGVAEGAPPPGFFARLWMAIIRFFKGDAGRGTP